MPSYINRKIEQGRGHEILKNPNTNEFTQRQWMESADLWVETTTHTLTYQGEEGIGEMSFTVQRSVVADEMYCQRFDEISGQYVKFCRLVPAWDESHVVEIEGVAVPLEVEGWFYKSFGQVIPKEMDFLMEASFPLGDDTPEWQFNRFLKFFDYYLCP